MNITTNKQTVIFRFSVTYCWIFVWRFIWELFSGWKL